MPTKVLVFESDPAFAGELRTELGKLGCVVTVVDDGNVGLQQASAERPELILLSIELPRMNGFSVCNKLKKDPSLKDVPLVIMSSESSDETFEQHKKLRTRAEDYLHKPIAFSDLLAHIQPLVSLGAPSGEHEGAILIDDEIEVGTTDYVVEEEDAPVTAVPAPEPVADDRRSPSDAPTNVPPANLETVDADIDAFAETAFGRMTGPEAAAAALATGAEMHAPSNGASEALAVPGRRSVAPSAGRASLRPPPPPVVDLAEHDKVRVELVRARERLGATERDLEEARREVDKLRIEAGESDRLAREVDELKAKLASGARTGVVSSRDFLDLREALNRKDKDILGLKEQLSRKDRESVEAQDRALALERSKADLDERLLGLEREITETKEQSEAVATERDLAKKASDDYRARLDKTRAESEAKDRQLGELRSRHAEELAVSEARMAAMRAELDQALANERAEQARALDEAEEQRRQALDYARREKETALADAREQAEHARRDALGAQAAQLQHDHEVQRGALVDQAEGRRQADLAAAQVEAERQKSAALDALVAKNAEHVAALEADRDARLGALETRASRELGDATGRIERLTSELGTVGDELRATQEAKRSADASSAARISDLEHRIADAESARQATATSLADAHERLATESARADRAYAKWDADRRSLDRAKDALAVALAQVEEAEARPIA